MRKSGDPVFTRKAFLTVRKIERISVKSELSEHADAHRMYDSQTPDLYIEQHQHPRQGIVVSPAQRCPIETWKPSKALKV